MTAIINIGLKTGLDREQALQAALGLKPALLPHQPQDVGPEYAITLLRSKTRAHWVVAGDDEDTLVMVLTEPLTEWQINFLCYQMQQIAIAQLDLKTLEGKLLGPLAHLWGEFDLEMFRT